MIEGLVFTFRKPLNIIYKKTKNNDTWVLTDEERKLSLAVLIQNINVSESERRIIMRSYAIHLLVRVKL